MQHKLSAYWYRLSFACVRHRVIGVSVTKWVSGRKRERYCAFLRRNLGPSSTGHTHESLFPPGCLVRSQPPCCGNFRHGFPSECQLHGRNEVRLSRVRQPSVRHTAGEVQRFVLCDWRQVVDRPAAGIRACTSNEADYGSVTMTTEVGTDGTTTLSRMNLSGYVGHVTIFSSMFTIACCLVVGLGLGLGLGLDLVSGW